ncbi:hypothetical protein HKD37_10G027665 [Glycine soja]
MNNKVIQLEAQDLELLSVVDNELINQQMERVTNNIGDEVTNIQATEEWTRIRDTLAMNIEMESSNMKNKSSGKRKMSSEDTRSYFAWNLEMELECVLADVLRDQRNLGNKGDGNWKALAYKAKRFRFKVIPNWDDIVNLCAKDKATGLEAENALDADDIMSKEINEEEAIHSVSFDLEGSSSATRKNNRPSKSGEKEGKISSMKEVVESLKEFVEVTKKKMENKKKMEIKKAQEVVHEVKRCEGIPVLKQMQLENLELFWKLDLFCD